MYFMSADGSQKPENEMSFSSILIAMVGLALVCTGFGIHYEPIIENEVHNLILALVIGTSGGATVYSVMSINNFDD